MKKNLAYLFLVIAISILKIIPGFSLSGDPPRVIAYYLGNGEDLERYDILKVTHIIFCFGQLNGHEFSIRGRDTLTIRKMVAMKKVNPGLKVIVSLGGGRGCRTCSGAFSTKEGRSEFAHSIRKFHSYFGTDGLDLDWEFPNVEHFPGQEYNPADKKNFTKLAREIKRVNPDKELSFAAGAHEGIFEIVVEWKKIMRVMDYVNLMTYDIGSYQNRPDFREYRDLALGSDSKNTIHHTALFSTPDILHSVPGSYNQYKTPGQERSVDFCVKYLLNRGIPAEKIIVGAAFYGRMYQDVPVRNNGLYQPAKYLGTISFRDFSSRITSGNGYQFFWDDQANAPYSYNVSEHTFVTYDDKRSVALKTKYVLDHRLGGIMFWQLRNDSYRNGLLDVIDRTIRNPESAGTK